MDAIANGVDQENESLEDNIHDEETGNEAGGSQVLYAPLSIEEGQDPTVKLPPRVCFKRRRCCVVAATLVVSTLLIAFAVSILFPTLNIPWSKWWHNMMITNTQASCPIDRNSTHLDHVHPSQLVLNHIAQPLENTMYLQGAHYGFVWNNGDNNTAKWRPQGITIATFDSQKYALVSWYGRADQDYANRGARISFVHLSSFRYRHVLLVHQNLCTFASLHAGGIEYLNGKLHVPDSRHKGKVVRVFDVMTGLYEINSNAQDDLFGYRYILVQESMYNVPTVPSFISYDFSRDMMIVGTYYHCGGSASKQHEDTNECLSRPENKLAWYNLGKDNHSVSCTPFFSEMQGVASIDINNKSILWVVSSYGPHFDSHLHRVVGFDPLKCDNGTWGGVRDYMNLSYPPGLEDLHIERLGNGDRQIMWMLTEFGTRTVFCTDIEKLLPEVP